MYNSYYYSDADVALGGFILVLLLLGIIFAVAGYIITALIYYITSKTNGFSDVAYIAWIPIVNIYSLLLLTADGTDNTSIRDAAKKNTLIYVGLVIVSFIPFIGWFASIALAIYGLYFTYRLLYRWCGESGKAILYIVLTFITGGIFFAIYGLLRMNKPFVA